MMSFNFDINSLNLNGIYFITGTDTEIGKTTVTRQLIKALAAQGQACYAIKPVTAGLETVTIGEKAGEKYSDDAQRINAFATVKPPLSAVAPILLTTPSSPHIAAYIDGVSLSAQMICQQIQQTLHDYPADTVLVEGAGGWFTPINDTETLADVARLLDLSVIVVVGVKLGCLNHAVLTVQAIQQAGLNISAIVFNQLSPDGAFYHEQITWLEQYLRQNYFLQTNSPIFLQNPFVEK